MQAGIQVKAEGRRFCDEPRGYSEQAADVLRQPGSFAWNVFDDRNAGIARQLRPQADIVVASCHWGLGREPLQYMTDIARAAIDAGADVVMGARITRCPSNSTKAARFSTGWVISHSRPAIWGANMPHGSACWLT